MCGSLLDDHPRWYSVRIAVNLALLGGALGSYRRLLRYLHRAEVPLRHPIPEKRLITARDVAGAAPDLRGGQGARE
ncbi:MULTISPECIES: hypothetical protein [unclassified Frankia]|uniref:hypothetical protein n=1 Tax=unclassified Frankia TaxID=2632575 RepID=UPI001EF7121A|nr:MULTISPECIES: hypothetical protein [unclassified Frankia]